MASRTKRKLKAVIIRWELHLYVIAALTYFAAVPTLAVVFPDVSNLWVSIFILVSGFFGMLAAMASAIKSDDTTE